MSGLRFQVGSDVGGTFTDLWVQAGDGRTETVKTPTTADVIGGVMAALSLAAEAFGLSTEEFCVGVLDPENFVGGRLRLDVQAARRGIAEHVAEPLGVAVEQAAWGIREVLDSRMADLLRQVTIARGHDPREFTIIAGGGGPSHAWALARELGVREVIVPAFATAQSAYGTCADIRMNAERTAAVRIAAAGPVAAAQAEAVAGALEEAVQSALAALDSRAGPASVRLERTLATSALGTTPGTTLHITIRPANRHLISFHVLTVPYT